MKSDETNSKNSIEQEKLDNFKLKGVQSVGGCLLQSDSRQGGDPFNK